MGYGLRATGSPRWIASSPDHALGVDAGVSRIHGQKHYLCRVMMYVSGGMRATWQWAFNWSHLKDVLKFGLNLIEFGWVWGLFPYVKPPKNLQEPSQEPPGTLRAP